MTVRCPTCGAEVEFRYDDSFVRVCEHCRAAVVRTDRGVETLGAFADLVPIQSALQLFAEVRPLAGSAGFLLIGMAQLRHAAGGVWQEWYARGDDGQWAWISEAQGRLYLTFERPDVPVPPFASLSPGTAIQLAGTTFTVAERGTASYVSAQGEIPYRLVPSSSFQFVDLFDGRGGFATIDYGDGSEPPAIYLGHQVTPQELGISGGEAAPQLVAPATGARLACPHCNGPLELRAPDQALRVTCPFCNSLVSVEGGTLAIIARHHKKPTLALALGTRGTFLEGELTVIGHVGRSAYIDGSWWPFEEYLLYAPGVGFRWLVCSDGHWSYVQPVAGGAVEVGTVEVGRDARYNGVAFRRFQAAKLRVDTVLGEFYWRVQAGEQVSSEDYIAPPAMLSREATASEENWSLSTYLTPQELDRAFGKQLGLPSPIGVAPNQPYGAGLGKVMALVTVAFFAAGIGKCASAPADETLRQRFTFPVAPLSGESSLAPSSDPAASAEPASNVMFSDTFHLGGGKNVAFDLASSVSNSWVYASLDLVNDDTGHVISFDKSIEYYAGYDADGSWTEGSTTADEVIGPVAPGTYVLRVEAQHGAPGPVDLEVVIRQGVFRWAWFGLFFGALAISFGLVGLHAYASATSGGRTATPGRRAGLWGWLQSIGDNDAD